MSHLVRNAEDQFSYVATSIILVHTIMNVILSVSRADSVAADQMLHVTFSSGSALFNSN